MYASALMIGGLCHGMIYVAGMSYVHIRAGAYRVQRVAFLHIVYLFGVATTAHSVHAYNKEYVEPREDGLWKHATNPISYHFFGYSGLAVIVLVINFLLQGRLYNARAPMDPKVSVANGKFDNFKSTLGMPVMQAIAAKPDTFNQLKVTKVMLTSKLTGGLLFNNLFIGLVMYSQRQLFTGDGEEFSFITHYMVIVGLVFGYGASFFVQLKWLFIPGTFLHCILLIIALSLYTVERYVASTVFMWLFYIVIGIVYLVPDNGLMEVAPLQYYEAVLGVGYCFEAVPLMIASYMMNRGLPAEPKSLWIAGGVSMTGLIVAAILMIFWFPDTLRKGIIEIQYMLLYPNKIINIRPPVAPVQETVTLDLESPPKHGPIVEEKPVQIMPVVPDVPYPEVRPVHPIAHEEVPYPEVKPSVGIQSGAAVTMDEVNGSALYPGPSLAAVATATAPTLATIETTDIYAEKGKAD